MRAELCQLLINGKGAGCSCGWAKNRSVQYALLLSEYEPLRMLGVPISDIVKKMVKVSSQDVESKYHSTNHNAYWHEAQTDGGTFPGKLENIKRKASICFDCLRTGGITTSCKFQHK
jgi:hypothetical protein